MNARWLALVAPLLVAGCGADEVQPSFSTGGLEDEGLDSATESSSTDAGEGASMESADQSGDGDGDGDATTGDGDGSSGDGDGDGTTGDGDGTTGDGDGTSGDGDGTTGDGDGDTGDGTTTGPSCTTGDGDGDGDGDGTWSQGASYAGCVADSDCPNPGEVCINFLNNTNFCTITCNSVADCNPELPGGSVPAVCDANIGILEGTFNQYCAMTTCAFNPLNPQSNCPSCMRCTNYSIGVTYCGWLP